jgi:hypothetical protein
MQLLSFINQKLIKKKGDLNMEEKRYQVTFIFSNLKKLLKLTGSSPSRFLGGGWKQN